MEPQNEEETEILVDVLKLIGTEPEPNSTSNSGSGSSELGGEGLFDAVVGNRQTVPRSFARKTSHKQTVIAIDVRP